jgi:hypothetical protein
VFVSPSLLGGRIMGNADAPWFKPPWEAGKPAEFVNQSNPEIDDIPMVILPFAQYARDRAPDVALWNPYIMSGRTFLADAQSAIFSPFSLPWYVLSVLDSLAWIIALKLFVAALGMFMLARSLGLRFGGALLAGVVFGFNQWIVEWVLYPHASVWALMPWLLFATDRLVRRPDGVTVAGVGLAAALVLVSGHPESAFHAFVAAGILFALRAGARHRERPRELVRPALAFVSAIGLGVAAAGVAIIPFLELLNGSADLEQRAGVAKHAWWPAENLMQMFMSDYFGRPTGTALKPFSLAWASYAGGLPLIFGALALILRPTWGRVAVALGGFACMAVAFGLWPIFDIVTALPIFSSGHNTRLIAVYMLCLALLAGWGLDDVTGPPVSRRRMLAAAGVAAGIIALPALIMLARNQVALSQAGRAVDVAWRFAAAPPIGDTTAPAVIKLAALTVWLTFAAAVAALLLARWRAGLAAAAVVALAVGLTAGDLARAGIGLNPAITHRRAEQDKPPVVDYLRAHRPARFVAYGDIPADSFPMRYGLYDARGYDLPIERRYDRFWRTKLSPELPSQVGQYPINIQLTLLAITPKRLRTLSLLGVRDILDDPDLPPLDTPGLRLVYDRPDARVYENPGVFPRTWLAGDQDVVRGGDAALAALDRRDLDLRRTVVVEDPIPGIPRAGAGAPAAAAGSAGIARYGEERVSLSVRARRPGVVVLSDPWYPGWKATVDGRDAEVERVDYVLRGVRVPAGTHRVELRYAPASWRLAWILSLLGVLALSAVAIAGARRRRSPPPAQ